MSYHALDGRLLVGPDGRAYEALGKPCCASCASGHGCEGGLSGLAEKFPGGKAGIMLAAAGLVYIATRPAARSNPAFAEAKPPKKPPQPKDHMVYGEVRGMELSWGPMSESAAKGKMTFYGRPQGIKVKNLRMVKMSPLEQLARFFFVME